MSRHYEVTWDIKDATPEEVSKINSEILCLDGGYSRENHWFGWGNLTLGGGVSPEEYGEGIAKSVFDVLGRKIPIEFTVTYIEQAPIDIFSYGGE